MGKARNNLSKAEINRSGDGLATVAMTAMVTESEVSKEP